MQFDQIHFFLLQSEGACFHLLSPPNNFHLILTLFCSRRALVSHPSLSGNLCEGEMCYVAFCSRIIASFTNKLICSFYSVLLQTSRQNSSSYFINFFSTTGDISSVQMFEIELHTVMTALVKIKGSSSK